MKYIDPLTETISMTYNDIEHSFSYYKPPLRISGVDDESYEEFNIDKTYSIGEYVKIDSLKRIFRSGTDDNIGSHPLESSKWVDYGTLNTYKMLATDEDIGSKTVGTDGIFEFDFSRCNAMAWVDVEFFSSRVILIRTDRINYLSDYKNDVNYAVGDAVIFKSRLYKAVSPSVSKQPDISEEWEEDTENIYFNKKINGLDIGCSNYAEYFYTSAKRRTRKIITGLDWLPKAIMRIEIEGDFKIGTIAYNKEEDFGASLVGSLLRYESSSKFKTNEFTGFRTVLRFGKVRILEVDVIFDKILFNKTVQTVDKLIDKNIIWIPTSSDNFHEAITMGYIEQMDVPMELANKFKTRATIIGVNK